jgi:hypothetical protein
LRKVGLRPEIEANRAKQCFANCRIEKEMRKHRCAIAGLCTRESVEENPRPFGERTDLFMKL